jgi:hypothetical protein
MIINVEHRWAMRQKRIIKTSKIKSRIEKYWRGAQCNWNSTGFDLDFKIQTEERKK